MSYMNWSLYAIACERRAGARYLELRFANKSATSPPGDGDAKYRGYV